MALAIRWNPTKVFHIGQHLCTSILVSNNVCHLKGFIASQLIWKKTFVHRLQGVSELEYFGAGRFLLMGTNHTNHLDFLENSSCLKSGGKISDGWSYIMPEDNVRTFRR